MSVYRIVRTLQDRESLHLARLLILVNGFSRPERDEGIEGLGKLANLDFLLRYPTFLERALERRNASTKNLAIEVHERKSVESAMVRYRYGPWDHRYRLHINNLAARGLVRLEVTDRSFRLQVTEAGRSLADVLLQEANFEVIGLRVRTLRTHFDREGSYLMKFIYEAFPEIASLRVDEEIPV